MLNVLTYQTRSYIELTDAVIIVQNLTINKTVRKSETIENGQIVEQDSTTGHINFRAAVYASQSAFEQGAEPVEYFQEAAGNDNFNVASDDTKTGREQAYEHLMSLESLNETTLAEGVTY